MQFTPLIVDEPGSLGRTEKFLPAASGGTSLCSLTPTTPLVSRACSPTVFSHVPTPGRCSRDHALTFADGGRGRLAVLAAVFTGKPVSRRARLSVHDPASLLHLTHRGLHCGGVCDGVCTVAERKKGELTESDQTHVLDSRPLAAKVVGVCSSIFTSLQFSLSWLINPFDPLESSRNP